MEFHQSGRHLHHDLIAGFLAQESLCDRRLDRDFSTMKVSLVRIHYGVSHAALISHIGNLHLTQQSHLVALQSRLVYYTCILQNLLLETDSAQQLALLSLGSMILKVLAEVALVACLGYGVTIDNIASSASHLSRLVASLLDYHKLENGLLELHPSNFSPASLIQQCTEGMRMQAEKKNLMLSSSYQDKAAELQGLTADAAITYQADAFRIRQVLDNLISNAIKYTVKGKVTVTGLVKPAPSAGICHLIIKVEDTGMGMTSEECRKVFQAFTRLKDAQGIEGTGLGLSITHELVTLLGGHISLQSEKGIGSTFAITLPIRQNPLSVQEASTGEAAEKQPASISAAGTELSSATLL